MALPVITGVIDRRLLINFRVDPATLAAVLPSPFRPKLVGGFGIAGICLIRLRQMRPRWLPAWMGISSENAAHRIAVEWDHEGAVREGVYIPQRHSGARMNAWLGGRLFPGTHEKARFAVDEDGDRIGIAITENGCAQPVLRVRGHVDAVLPRDSVFASLDAASSFFAGGSIGFSPARRRGSLEGLRLASRGWRVDAFTVDEVESRWFADRTMFPEGSVRFDCGLIMRRIEHEWHVVEPRACGASAA